MTRSLSWAAPAALVVLLIALSAGCGGGGSLPDEGDGGPVSATADLTIAPGGAASARGTSEPVTAHGYTFRLESDYPDSFTWDGSTLTGSVRINNETPNLTMYGVDVRIASINPADQGVTALNDPWSYGDVAGETSSDWMEWQFSDPAAVQFTFSVRVTWWTRPGAGTAGCVGNLKRIGEAMSAYAADWENCLPAGRNYWETTPSDWQNGRPYFVRIHPYMPGPSSSSWDVFSCPDAAAGWSANGSIAFSSVDEAIEFGEAPATFRLSYGYNECVFNSPFTGSLEFRLDTATVPSRDVLVADAMAPVNDNWQRIGWANVCCAACVEDRMAPTNTRHYGGSNVLFVDGHVDRVVGAQAYHLNYGRGQWGNARW